MGSLVPRAAKKWPANLALTDTNGSVTYHELEGRVTNAARNLWTKGIRPGQRIGILSRNTISAVEAYFAASRIGAVTVWLDPMADAAWLKAISKDAGFSLIVAEKEIEEITMTHNSNNFKELKESKNDLASIVYTSGTTGDPLGVMLTHRNLIANNQAIVRYMKLADADKLCCVLPFYYIYGLSLLLSHVLAGASIILENRFIYPQVVLDTIEKNEATGFAGVSSHYAILLTRTDLTARLLKSLRYFTQAGDRMPTWIARKLSKSFPNKEIYLMYGQTEASPRLSFLDPKKVKIKPGSVGQAIPGVRLKVVDEKGLECPIGKEGEITAQGDNVMAGYWQRPEETAQAIRNGWLYTGDVGFKDADGDLFITGRKKELLKVGGHRISPVEIERLAGELDGIEEAAVVGAPDATLGQKICFYFTVGAAQKLTEQDVSDFFKAKLPLYKIPQQIIRVEDMPKNSMGKIDKRKLTEAVL